MIAILKLRWQQRLPRERWLLLAAAGALLLLVGQQAILSPLQNWQQQQQLQLQRAERDLQWMQQQQARLTQLQQPSAPQQDTRAQLLKSSAAQKKVPFTDDGNGALALAAQPFPPLLSWLIELEQRHALQPTHLMLQAAPDGSLLKGTLRFEHDR